MAKDKSQQKPPKRKKLPPIGDEVCVEQTKESKRKKLKVEEAPVQMPDVDLAVEEGKKTKVKKHKKKRTTEQTETTMQIQISDPADAPAGEEDLSPEERRVRERKLKKILKKKMKAEGLVPPKNKESTPPAASQQALDYLTCWADNRAAWKFQKTRQTWLLQNMFDSEQIRDEKFSVLLQYLEGLCGGSRDTTVQKALVLVQESGQAPDDGNVQKRAHRAREVIQMLS